VLRRKAPLALDVAPLSAAAGASLTACGERKRNDRQPAAIQRPPAAIAGPSGIPCVRTGERYAVRHHALGLGRWAAPALRPRQ